jgi:hypothetical protein
MTLADFTSQLTEAYLGFISSLPPFFQSFFNLFFLALLVFLYAVFIWKLHKFISTKNILNLNLDRYNTAEHPFLVKLIAIGLYFLEYIIILPFLVFFWFAVFGLFMIIFTNLEIDFILIVSAVIVAAIRITAYYKESIAKEVAKLLPLNLLAIALIVPGFFEFERVLSNISLIPDFFSQILSYMGFIIILEIILRFFDFVFSLFNIKD